MEVSPLVSVSYVKCLSEKIANTKTGEIAMKLQSDFYNEAHEKMIEEVEATISNTASYTGITRLSLKILKALEQVPRHLFVLPGDENYAYLNAPLSIGEGQTISQPFIVALMTELLDLQPEDNVLEIGTGSGYQAAILSQLAQKVYTIEVVDSLAQAAQKKLNKLGYGNIHVLKGDGRQGWAAHAPYNKIIVTAASENVPPKLLEQLSSNGTIVIPLGKPKDEQFLTLIYKDKEGNITQRTILSVRFVPFT